MNPPAFTVDIPPPEANTAPHRDTPANGNLIAALFAPGGALNGTIEDFEVRPVQARMARLVVDAVAANRHLLVEAGTGTGKTLAYLAPLLALGGKLVVSTATRALQDQIIGKDLPVVRRVVGRPFEAVALKGRGNYLCLYRFRQLHEAPWEATLGIGRVITELKRWARDTRTGDRDELTSLPERLDIWSAISAGSDRCLGRECEDFEDCFLMVARNRARKADLVVANHHLYFADLALLDEGFGQILPKHDIAVFDEAHQLPDVATLFFGQQLSNHQIQELVRDVRWEFDRLRADDPRLFDALASMEEGANRLRQAFPEESRREGLRPEDFGGDTGRALLLVEGTLHRFLECLAPHRDRGTAIAALGRRAELLLETSGNLRTLDDPGKVHWFETRRRGVFLSVSPLEVGPLLRESLFQRLKSAIFTSATLATGRGVGGFRYLESQLGLAPGEAMTELLPPAFDHARQALLYLPERLPDPDAPGFKEAVIAELHQLLRASSGRALCLFTSYRMLHAVREGLVGQIPYPLLTQGERPRAALLNDFRRLTDSVLLGVGSFWEGVDVPGEALSLVVIDRLPFPSPADPLMAARGRQLRAAGQQPFTELFLPRAVLTLKQGVGRLLRRNGDRGVMAILDPRLTGRSYGRLFFQGLPPVPVTRDPAEVAAFFRPSHPSENEK
ncbi:MAG: ATP-dependent DNA helicase [Magnetococcales bacterium]|nr:ATP-dependent DNA helicase [Magnetococcales bacterium]